MARIVWPAFLVGLCLALPMAALAQQPPQACGLRDRVLESLAKEYGEVLTARGVTDNGCLVEMTLSPNGSWTLLTTCPGMPPAMVCAVGTGSGWKPIAPPLPGKGA